ncbi:MAG TPA: TIGR03560 family F420-dependent LLM class oxidoreductase, partial [Dehalococcoidia bacterium]|nr:TIGR03560 family F420-dependent LLM class oxidoreductase [Dehalococcoidia bacterium]
IWIGDHFMANAADTSSRWGEAWTTLAALAAQTSNVQLGTLVTGNTYRNPCILAKQVAQVDVISGGRVILGIGAGWQENEHVAYDVPFFTAPVRLQRLEESVQILRSLFDNPSTNFEGRHYHIVDAPLNPKPAQAHLPILIGGGGERVTLRLVAQYADAWNVTTPADEFGRKSHILDEHCERIGRDPASIHRTGAVLLSPGGPEGSTHLRFTPFSKLSDLVDVLSPFADAGADEMIVHFNPGLPWEQRKELWTGFMQDVAPQLT